jgi:hypothetical protein
MPESVDPRHLLLIAGPDPASAPVSFGALAAKASAAHSSPAAKRSSSSPLSVHVTERLA